MKLRCKIKLLQYHGRLFRHGDAEFRKKWKLVLNSPGSVSTNI